MPLRIVLDVRRVRDFGIGTYIRGLLHALADIDQSDEYTLVALPDDVASFAMLPANFQAIAYRRADSRKRNHLAFPWFLRSLSPSLVHIPLNQVPLFMTEPYVVTIHDMASLLFGTGSGMRVHARRFLLRRGLLRSRRCSFCADPPNADRKRPPLCCRRNHRHCDRLSRRAHHSHSRFPRGDPN